MIQRIFAFLIILAFVLIVGGYSFYQYILQQPLQIPVQSSLLEVSKGETLNKVLNELLGEGVIDDIQFWAAKLYLKEEYFQGRDIASKIKAGEFRLNEGLTIPNLFQLLLSNRQIQYQISLIEGSTFKQVMNALKQEPKMHSILADKSTKEIMALVPIDEMFETFHPEGLLFPDTYNYHKGDTDLSILQRAHKRLVEITKEEWQKREQGLPLKTPYDALILASIVEKETGKPSESDRVLELGYSLLDRVTFYRIQGKNVVEVVETGDAFPFDDRPTKQEIKMRE